MQSSNCMVPLIIVDIISLLFLWVLFKLYIDMQFGNDHNFFPANIYVTYIIYQIMKNSIYSTEQEILHQ